MLFRGSTFAGKTQCDMMKAKKTKLPLLPKSRLVRQETEDMDTVRYQHRMHGDRSMDVLFRGMNCWANLDRFRRDRQRAKRYCYGDQWKDRVPNGMGGTQTEEDYIRKQGSIPLKNNLIRRLCNNVEGVLLGQDTQPVCKARDRAEQAEAEVLTTALECNWELNGMTELNAMAFEEFLISGMVVQRKCYEWRGDRADCWTDLVNPGYFFVDGNIRRADGKDASLVGEIHDISFGELCTKFAHSADDYARLKGIYAASANPAMLDALADEFGYNHALNCDYFIPRDPQLCRVLEIWTKECKPRYRCVDPLEGAMFKCDVEDYAALVKQVNEERRAEGKRLGYAEEDIPLIESEWCIDTYWYYRFLTPTGEVLDEGESPYDHKGHPYVMKFYPFIDGELHSFVSDVIDQQRYVNRLITLYDWIMRNSAKGVFFCPDDCLPSDMTWEDFAEEVTKAGGLVRYKVRPHGQVPHQVAVNSTNIGIGDLLQIQLKFFEDISGVNGALQGKPGYSQVSGVLYAQQTQNATTSLARLLQSFGGFVRDSAKMDVKNIQQYYTQQRFLSIAGADPDRKPFDPARLSDIDTDIKISESPASPTTRTAANAFLIEAWRMNQISLEQLLETGDFPFADRLLASVRAQQNAMQQQMAAGAPQGGGMAGGLPDGTPQASNEYTDYLQAAREQLRQASGDGGAAAARGYDMIHRAASAA